MATHKTKLALCPFCGHTVDRAFEAIRADGGPKAGDAAVCIRCARVSIYADDEGGLRMPTVAEQQELSQDQKIQSLCRFIREEVNAEGKGRNQDR